MGHTSHGQPTADPSPSGTQPLELPRPLLGEDTCTARPVRTQLLGHCLPCSRPFPAGRHREVRERSKPTWRRPRGRESQTGQGQGKNHTRGMDLGLSVDLPTTSKNGDGQPRVRGKQRGSVPRPANMAGRPGPTSSGLSWAGLSQPDSGRPGRAGLGQVWLQWMELCGGR